MTRLATPATDLADHLLATDPYLRALSDELWRGQRRLKRAAGPEAFRLYLRIEEVANELLLGLAERLWAAARQPSRSTPSPPPASSRHGR